LFSETEAARGPPVRSAATVSKHDVPHHRFDLHRSACCGSSSSGGLQTIVNDEVAATFAPRRAMRIVSADTAFLTCPRDTSLIFMGFVCAPPLRCNFYSISVTFGQNVPKAVIQKVLWLSFRWLYASSATRKSHRLRLKFCESDERYPESTGAVARVPTDYPHCRSRRLRALDFSVSRSGSVLGCYLSKGRLRCLPAMP